MNHNPICFSVKIKMRHGGTYRYAAMSFHVMDAIKDALTRLECRKISAISIIAKPM